MTEHQKLVFIPVPIEEFEDRISKLIETRVNLVHSNTNELPKYLTIQQAADVLQVSKPTLHKWGKTLELPKSIIDGVVRYKREDIENLIQSHRTTRYETTRTRF